MFKTCSDPDFNWVHCLCDSATWVVKEPGKPIGFFYSRLFDDALSPSGLGFAVDAFRIDEDGTLDDFYSDILWDYGAADELIAAYPNKFSCAVRCDGLNPYDIPTSWSHGEAERYRARDTVLAAVDMLIDDADETGIDACPEFYRNDYISMYIKTQGLGERVKVGGAEALRFSVVSTDCSCGDDEKGDFETLGEAMRAAKRLVDVEGYEGAVGLIRATEGSAAGVSDCALAQSLLITGFHHMQNRCFDTVSHGLGDVRYMDTSKAVKIFAEELTRDTGLALDAALKGKYAMRYGRDVDALIFTDADIDEYAELLGNCCADLDPEQRSKAAADAVREWCRGHVRGGKRPVGEQFELGVRPMAIYRGVFHRSPLIVCSRISGLIPIGRPVISALPVRKAFFFTGLRSPRGRTIP